MNTLDWDFNWLSPILRKKSGPPRKPFCNKGHPYTNLTKGGARLCRICRMAAFNRWKERHRAREAKETNGSVGD